MNLPLSLRCRPARVVRAVVPWALLPTCLCLGLQAPAQTYVVDASNGPGTQFLDLPAAISAVPNGAILRVRAGRYSPIVIANKSLTILGDTRSGVIVKGVSGSSLQQIVIGPTSPGHSILVRDLTLESPGAPAPIWVSAAQGRVVLESITTPKPLGGGNAFFRDSPNVHLLDLAPDNTQGPDMYVHAENTRLAIAHCVIRGVAGPIVAPFVIAGSPGLILDNAHGVVISSTIQGGTGSAEYTAWWQGRYQTFPPAEGGAGMLLSGPGVVVVGVTPRGGSGGCTGTNCTRNGAAISGPARVLPSHKAPDGTLAGTPARNQTVRLSLTAGANEMAVLALGYDLVHAPFPAITFGSLLVAPALIAGPFSTNGAGTLDVPLTLPGVWPLDQAIGAQFFTAPTGLGEVWGSNAFTIVVKS